MRVLRTFAVLLSLALGSILSLSAQSRSVSGKVLDTNGQPVIGAAVMVQGTTDGAITTDDGSFYLDGINDGDVVLQVTCLGYVSQELPVSAKQSTVSVILEEDTMLLEETVVVGYGTQKKVNLTGAISTVESTELADRASHSLTNMLQGSVAGLNITTSAGNPGSTPSINIRGVTSINNGKAEPLILVDGAIGDLNRVNPNDVASISVIKDASAAAVYGARAAFGVILITTKSGSVQDGKATVRYSGRFGWEEPTTSTDYETTGYWSVYTVNKFWSAEQGSASSLYCRYTDYDMQQLLARVNDKTEHPDRPWVVERDGKWVYYGNYDWWHMLFRDRHPVQQHSVSLSGGTKDIKYFVSGAFDRQTGILKEHPDVFRKYNLRSKLDFRINKWATLSNNTSFYGSTYSFVAPEGNIQNVIAYSARHALACFPMQNPDGTWLYSTPYLNYKIANGRHIVLSEGKDVNYERKTDFSNTTELVITPVKTFKITANFTYRFHQNRDTNRKVPFQYRENPGEELGIYDTGAGLNELKESADTWNYYSTNVFANYDETFNGAHHVSGVVGINYESEYRKDISASGQNLLSEDLNDLNLVAPDEEGNTLTEVSGGQNEYALFGVFARLNYDYKGKYLVEVSGRYDGTSRFAAGSRWGFFPSASLGWRISEEPFFKPARNLINNLKLRASFGSLGNQNVSSYYAFLRTIEIKNFDAYSFGEGSTMAQYATLSKPVASNLTWETSQQWNVGIDLGMLDNRLNVTVEGYIRDTRDMLTAGYDLPAVYGSSAPDMNTANLRTSGYEISASWRDQFMLAGKPFSYSVGANLSDYRSVITKYDNNDSKLLSDYYVGMEIGEIWGFKTDGLFQSTEEAQAYAQEVDLSMINNRITGGWQAGDLKFVDHDGNKTLSIKSNTLDDHGDLVRLGNELPSFQYGFNFGFSWYGFDVSAFFQGVGNHYWYPEGQSMPFWGPYSYPYLSYLPENFLDKVWSEDNRDAYFTRPMAYSATSGPLSQVNDRYIQNIRYLRFKNLTVGYTIPEALTKKIGIDQIRVYFSGENLCYWSPLKKNTAYLDPEAAIERDDAYNNAYYPWQKTYMFGIDITF